MAERWVRLYLPSLVLIPLGVVCIVLGHGLPTAENQLAITLVVLGTGLLVFGAFGPRMEGRFRIGLRGAEGRLSAEERMVAAANERLADAADVGEIPAIALPRLQEVATRAVLGAAALRRRYRVTRTRAPTEPEQVGRDVADAILEAARAPLDQG